MYFQTHNISAKLFAKINITIIATLLHSLLETWLFNFNGLLTMFFWLIILSTLELKKDINE